MDKAKAAANELAAKADTALASSGLAGPSAGPSPDKLFRDLGVLAWLELNGQPQPEGERERVLGALRDAEQRGALGPLTMQSTAPTPAPAPPPPGAAGSAQTPPPPPGGAATSSTEQVSPSATPTGGGPVQSTPPPPPPPPSWADRDES